MVAGLPVGDRIGVALDAGLRADMCFALRIVRDREGTVLQCICLNIGRFLCGWIACIAALITGAQSEQYQSQKTVNSASEQIESR